VGEAEELWVRVVLERGLLAERWREDLDFLEAGTEWRGKEFEGSLLESG
jgi:hypothetical protein